MRWKDSELGGRQPHCWLGSVVPGSTCSCVEWGLGWGVVDQCPMVRSTDLSPSGCFERKGTYGGGGGGALKNVTMFLSQRFPTPTSTLWALRGSTVKDLSTSCLTHC